MNSLSNTLYSLFTTNLTPNDAGLALGITFGIKDYVPKLLYTQMRIIGASHIMVLSGANISMLMNLVSFSLSYIPKQIREVIVIVLILFFVSAIPFQASVIRATIMCIAPRVGKLLGKRTHPLYLLILSCLCMIALDRRIMYEISFQLSFLAVLGMIWFDSSEVSTTSNDRIGLKKYIRSQLLTSLSAQVFTTPLIFYYFGTISLISPLSNIVLAPFITPIMGLSIVLAICTSIVPLSNVAISWAMHILLFIFKLLIQALARLDMFYISY